MPFTGYAANETFTFYTLETYKYDMINYDIETSLSYSMGQAR